MSRSVPDATHRLATYGTLAPGRPNHHRIAHIDGVWSVGHVHGHLSEHGWGAELGYPAITPDPDGEPVEVHLLESEDLPHHWEWLDEFEGEEYVRTPITVHTSRGDVAAYIYTHNSALA